VDDAAQSPSGTSGPPQQSGYAGERLGLPPDGPGSVASWGRRFAALFVDWIASVLVASVIVRAGDLGRAWEQWLPMLVFWLEASFFTALLGGSFGQLALRMVVVRLDRRPVSLLHALLRTALICLVIPPLVFNRDSRGLHYLAVGTVTIVG